MTVVTPFLLPLTTPLLVRFLLARVLLQAGSRAVKKKLKAMKCTTG